MYISAQSTIVIGSAPSYLSSFTGQTVLFSATDHHSDKGCRLPDDIYNPVRVFGNTTYWQH